MPVGRQSGGWGFCLAGRGALETQEQRRGQSWMDCGGLGRQSGLQRWGWGPYISGSPSSAWPTQGSPCSLTLSRIQHVQSDFQVGLIAPGFQKNSKLRMKSVRLEIGIQEAGAREPRTESPWLVHQVLGYSVKSQGSDLCQMSC